MKIILSHDVDHVSTYEHWLKDVFVWKFLFKTAFYLMTRRVGWSVGWRRLMLILGGRLQHVTDVMALDRAHGIHSTFFVGVENGLGMSYSLKAAARMVRLIIENGFEVGVHGIAYADGCAIKREFERFAFLLREGVEGATPCPRGAERTAGSRIGVRNHYLRFTPETPLLQQKAGYVFDSSDYGLKAPYFANGLLEFPVCMMDSHVLKNYGDSEVAVRQETLLRLEEAERLELPYFTVIFHDFYYSEAFPESKAWYDWFIAYIHERYETIDFLAARDEVLLNRERDVNRNEGLDH